jgi:hypothetical protein
MGIGIFHIKKHKQRNIIIFFPANRREDDTRIYCDFFIFRIWLYEKSYFFHVDGSLGMLSA